MALISVIIPTTRRPELLLRAIGSVLTQTLTDLEVIIVIDGPNSETIARLAEITDCRVRVVKNERPLGAAEARNVGAANSRAEWLAFLDDDDKWAPQKLERQLAIVGSSDEPVIVSCLAEMITPNRRFIWPRRVYDNSIPLADYLFDRKSIFKGETGLQTSCLMMPRSLFDSLKFTFAHDDWDLMLRAVKLRSARIVTVAEPLVIFYQDPKRQSLSTSFPWRDSLDWIEQNRSHMSRRAYSGFCLTVVAPQAAKTGGYSVFFMLLYRAFRNGLPRPTHIILYLIFWFRLRFKIGNILRCVTTSQSQVVSNGQARCPSNTEIESAKRSGAQ